MTFMSAATLLAIPPREGTTLPWTIQLSGCDQESVTLSLQVSEQDYTVRSPGSAAQRSTAQRGAARRGAAGPVAAMLWGTLTCPPSLCPQADLNLEPWPGAPPPWCQKWGYQDLFPGQARLSCTLSLSAGPTGCCSAVASGSHRFRHPSSAAVRVGL